MQDDQARLPTETWLKAHLRQCHSRGIPAMVVHRGDEDSGTIMLRLNLLGPGSHILSQARDGLGRPGWLAAKNGALLTDADADALIARAIDRDPSLWVIEIEHREGWHPFEGPMIE